MVSDDLKLQVFFFYIEQILQEVVVVEVAINDAM